MLHCQRRLNENWRRTAQGTEDDFAVSYFYLPPIHYVPNPLNAIIGVHNKIANIRRLCVPHPLTRAHDAMRNLSLRESWMRAMNMDGWVDRREERVEDGECKKKSWNFHSPVDHKSIIRFDSSESFQLFFLLLSPLLPVARAHCLSLARFFAFPRPRWSNEVIKESTKHTIGRSIDVAVVSMHLPATKHFKLIPMILKTFLFVRVHSAKGEVIYNVTLLCIICWCGVVWCGAVCVRANVPDKFRWKKAVSTNFSTNLYPSTTIANIRHLNSAFRSFCAEPGARTCSINGPLKIFG